MVSQAIQPTTVKAFSALMLTALLFVTSLPAKAELPNLMDVIEKNRNSVVNIATKGASSTSRGGSGQFDLDALPPQLREFFRSMPSPDSRGQRPSQDFQSLGSGFIISDDGYVVTNAHVIDQAESVRVTLKDRRELDAKVIGVDEATDIALLKIEAKNLPAVSLGDSAKLKVGQWVVAIGAPFGLEHSASQGIVSALSRSLNQASTTYIPFIQTDVAVNPGNSGGPLFDLDGNVVGVNSMIYSRSGGYQGISFSIPVNTVKNVTNQLKSKGFVSRGKLGVLIQDVNQELADSFNLPGPKGALVANVEKGSAADTAGLKRGDVIIGFNGVSVYKSGDLPPLVGNTEIGKRVPLTLIRGGKEKVFNVVVGQLDKKQGSAQATNTRSKDTFGVVVGSLDDEQRKAIRSDKGVVVNQVMGDSLAEKAGIAVNDIIISFNNVEVSSADELKSAIKNAPKGRSVPVLVIRDNSARYIPVHVPE
ncbi:DegQ family serine endoprotease [Leucothrix pacifica]|uniref:Probable periplasmic serine endoprotease DegP-like n=1 Tax=Leucothrix pacifica TaxID=1247513 RepID=A0A317C2J5_9GAMM|nr:DegQ family serine endoprotease [Leucothrix pacifica]PWQ92844.1 protease Do [Leucothrix pacifica]